MEMDREIQREVADTRYPILVGGEWLAPMDYYTMEKSRGIIEKATRVVSGIREAMEKKPA